MRWSYNKTAIINEWRKDKTNGYAQRLSKMFKVPAGTIHQVIHQYRKNRMKYNETYRAKMTTVQGKPNKSKRISYKFLQSHVIMVSAKNWK